MDIIARQLWGPVHTTTSYKGHCTPFSLPSGGVLRLNQSVVLTLTQNAQFSPLCTGSASAGVNGTATNNSTVVDYSDPFYASIAPQFFAIAAATVVAYLLVILIFITPGTSFVGGPGGASAFPGRRGVISGTYGSASVVGVGRRPWLQKIATLSVAISLTLASADTFKYCQQQYEGGYSDAALLVETVNAGLEIRVIRVISDTFLWLAQVQTLIRLFPRHKEKVTIKWLGFALILFDTIFSILNNLVYESNKTRPRRFADAIPALSYLFELSIGLIYASCVIYYSLSKRRFAFWHAKMRNICLVALCSLMAVLIPVVFFVLDVSNADVATWGAYIRWVGAAAASVVVWEWVERIEALERDERKDGILGREIFDGDEMLDMTPSEEVVWPGRSPYHPSHDQGGAADASGWATREGPTHRPPRSRVPFQSRPSTWTTAANISTGTAVVEAGRRPPERPPPAITPISRTDTSSASTVYAVRRLPQSPPSPQGPAASDRPAVASPQEASAAPSATATVDAIPTGPAVSEHQPRPQSATTPPPTTNLAPLWRAVPNPFKRRRASPPAEVADAQSTAEKVHHESAAPVASARPTAKVRAEASTASQKRKLRNRGKGQSLETPLEVTVIPAQRRGQRTWSPDDLVDPGGDGDGMKHEHGDGPMDELDEVPSLRASRYRTDAPVIVIPAPSRSRPHTWPRPEMDEPSTTVSSRRPPVAPPAGEHPESPRENTDQGGPHGGREEPAEGISGTAERAPSNGQASSGPVLSRRGTLTISETEMRNPPGSYRRSFHSHASPNGAGDNEVV